MSDGTTPNSPIDSFSEKMLHIFTSLTNLSIHTIQPLELWEITNVIMLEKEKGSPKINLLCAIEKYEIDYNFLVKLYWPKVTTQHAKQEGTLGKIKLGTRPNKSSNDECATNDLILDPRCIQKCILPMKQNDASAC